MLKAKKSFIYRGLMGTKGHEVKCSEAIAAVLLKKGFVEGELPKGDEPVEGEPKGDELGVNKPKAKGDSKANGKKDKTGATGQ